MPKKRRGKGLLGIEVRARPSLLVLFAIFFLRDETRKKGRATSSRALSETGPRPRHYFRGNGNEEEMQGEAGGGRVTDWEERRKREREEERRPGW